MIAEFLLLPGNDLGGVIDEVYFKGSLAGRERSRCG